MTNNEYQNRYVIERDGRSIALEPYENDRWELTIDGKVVHQFVSETLNLQGLVKLLIEKGHLSEGDAVGLSRLTDWKSYMIVPPPEENS